MESCNEVSNCSRRAQLHRYLYCRLISLVIFSPCSELQINTLLSGHRPISSLVTTDDPASVADVAKATYFQPNFFTQDIFLMLVRGPSLFLTKGDHSWVYIFPAELPVLVTRESPGRGEHVTLTLPVRARQLRAARRAWLRGGYGNCAQTTGTGPW